MDKNKYKSVLQYFDLINEILMNEDYVSLREYYILNTKLSEVLHELNNNYHKKDEVLHELNNNYHKKDKLEKLIINKKILSSPDGWEAEYK